MFFYVCFSQSKVFQAPPTQSFKGSGVEAVVWFGFILCGAAGSDPQAVIFNNFLIR